MKKTVSFSRNATNVFFHILTKCNLNCSHCYINPKQHGENILPISTIESWLEIFAYKSKISNVIFLGGEPTLHPNLPEAVKKARNIGYKSITIDTNGYLFHDILSKISPVDVDFISFSLDGATKETNDSIRGNGCFETCTRGIHKANAKGFTTSLIYTVSGKNIHELKLMPPLLKNLGIKEFFIQVIGIRGNSTEDAPRSLQVTKDTWQKVIPEVAGIVADLGINVTYPKVFLNENDIFECGGLVAENHFIFPNGRVYRCPLCEDFPIHANIIKDNRLEETAKLNEIDFFNLTIPEGCVMNKMVQSGNLSYCKNGHPEHRIACCLVKEHIRNSR